MIIEKIGEPTVTLTLTVTELKRLRDACGWAIDGLERNAPTTKAIIKQHQELQTELRAALADVPWRL